ncbi:MAG TPA: hypothetical protein VJX10_15805 [Pseudonocardiaceae bacterium]|nr:hypothetical protein [Pseudonocardiaceae bacterium]
MAATGLLLALQFVELASIEEHGQELSGLGHFEVIENPIVFVVAVIAAIFVTSRRPWARPLAVIVEMLAIINGVINVVSGLPTGVVAIGLAATVITLLARPEVGAWFNQRPDAATEYANQEQPGFSGNQTS